MASMKLPPEPSDNYTLWRKDIEVWKKLTDTPKAKMGVALQYACRNKERLHEAVLNIPDEQVDGEEGITNVLKVLDELHCVDKRDSALRCYNDFESLIRKDRQNIADFILEFEALYNKAKTNGNQFSDDLLAYKLLKAANLSESDERMVKASTSKFEFKSIKETLKRTFGETTGTIREEIRIKQEPLFYTSNSKTQIESEEELTFYTNKWKKNKEKFKSPTFSKLNKGKENEQRFLKYPIPPGRNPLDRFGYMTHCNICYSVNHWAATCPDKTTSYTPKDNVTLHQIVLYEEDIEDPNRLNSLVYETLNCAVLDTGCAKTVCGKGWISAYISSLTQEEEQSITKSDSNSVFKFGSGDSVKSLGTYTIPVSIGTKEVKMKVDVVSEDIPLLLSKRSMQMAGVILDTLNNKVTMLGEVIPLVNTSTDHYAIPIHKNKYVLETNSKIVLLSRKQDLTKKEIASKLHRQFGHPPVIRLQKLLEKSDYNLDEELIKEINDVSNECEICKRYKPAPRRPIVGLPLASKFNQTVCMDIKFINGQPVIHLIDALTRYSAAGVLYSKEPRGIINFMFRNWICIFGPPDRFLSDNGGEFANQEMMDMAEAFNINLVTTAAESPWANGLCERYNAVLGEMTYKILEDVKCSLSVAVAWAVSAKNTLQNIHGFSPAQLVFGYTPILPSVQINKPPALSETTYSKYLEEHLEAMRKARSAYIYTESSIRIRRALNHNTRSSNDVKYITGDNVYYKRRNEARWRGPGTVIGQDGQFVLVRHQSTWIRVHPCRLQLISTTKEIDQLSTQPEENKKKEITNNNILLENESDYEVETTEIDNDQTEFQVNPENDTHVTNEIPNQLPSQSQSLDSRVNIENQLENIIPNQLPSENQSLDSSVNKESQLEDTEATNENKLKMNADDKQEKLDNEQASQLKSNEEKWDIKKNKDLLKIGNSIQYKLLDDETWKIGTLISRSGKASGKYAYEWNIQDEEGIKQINFENDVTEVREYEEETTDIDEVLINHVFLNEIKEEVLEAKKRELDSWKLKEVYEEVEGENQDLMSLHWVVKPKMKEGTLEMKARLVAGGDEETVEVRKDSPTCSKPSIRICLMIISSFGWKLKSIDIKCAFLQTDTISREIFVKPPKEAQTNKVWRLKKTVYGLMDASRVWFLKVTKELTLLGCEPLETDPAVFVFYYLDNLHGILACFVDDMLYGGSSIFLEQVIEKLRVVLTVGSESDESFTYLGINLMQGPDNAIYLDQNFYLNKLKPIQEISSFSNNYMPDAPIDETIRKKMRSTVGCLNWLSTVSRPDISYDTCVMATKVCSANQKDIVKLNKIVKNVVSNPLTLKFTPLSSIKQIIVYTDAAYANLEKGFSQGAYLIFVGDDEHLVPIDWSSHKLTRVARSTLTAESLALMDGIDAAWYYKHILTKILRLSNSSCDIPIICYTDSQSLVDAAKTTNVVSEKRLRIELGAVRQMVENKEIIIKWVPTKEQLADSLTKDGAGVGKLRQILESGEWNIC